MAEADDDEIFVYMGGNQSVPDRVRRAKIHISVKIVPEGAFVNHQYQNSRRLMYVEFHDDIEIVEEDAFNYCYSLRGPIKLLGVRIIKERAFGNCRSLTDVEFGDKLETIERSAFNTNALKKIRIPSVRTVGMGAFASCMELSDVEFGEALMTLEEAAFIYCDELKRIALPLKANIIEDDVFNGCPKLTTVDLVGGVHKTVASLHLECWRNEMNEEINRINQVLPTTPSVWNEKTVVIQEWMESVFHQLNHYKVEHNKLLKEATTLLELALWKANLDDSEGGEGDREGVRMTRGSRKRARKEICVTCGASIVIKNVLPFLVLK